MSSSKKWYFEFHNATVHPLAKLCGTLPSSSNIQHKTTEILSREHSKICFVIVNLRISLYLKVSRVAQQAVSGYGLDDRAIKFGSRQRRKDLSSSLCVQTGSGAHPASCTMCTGSPFPGGKARPRRDADH
jgi:hypothetical protein